MPGGLILVTGATGHVGGRLLEALRADGRELRVLVRDGGAFPADRGEVVEGDVRDAAAARRALSGVEVAYYLIHSLGEDDFGAADREAALAFGAAAREAGVRRIVYLGGIGRGELSPHLASRQEVGRVLRDSGVQTVELRASILIGRGSASFEAFRALVEALPLLPLPDWARNPSQPIATDDVVAYLVEAGTLPLEGSVVVEIGGADRVPYTAIAEEIARREGRTAVVATVPAPAGLGAAAELLKPLGPQRARVVADLLESLRNDTSVSDDTASRLFSVRPRGLGDAVAAALAEG